MIPARSPDAAAGSDDTRCARFLVHIKDVLSSLTITKAGADITLDPNQSFLFTVTGGNLPTSGLKVTVTATVASRFPA
jgi:hypothetical protein